MCVSDSPTSGGDVLYGELGMASQGEPVGGDYGGGFGTMDVETGAGVGPGDHRTLTLLQFVLTTPTVIPTNHHNAQEGHFLVPTTYKLQ